MICLIYGRSCGLAAKLCRPGPHCGLHCHGFFAALELGTVSLPCSMQWVLFGVVAWGVRVIPLSPPPQGAFQCMLLQAEGRSEYVSPMGFPSGAYALGSHSATGPSWLGSHWLWLLGAFRGVGRALQPELSMTNRRELRWQDESVHESLATHPGLQPTNQPGWTRNVRMLLIKKL